MIHGTTLPVHGFVLVGGKSSRMGSDKAMLPFLGRPMVEIAVEKLRHFCACVSLAGNRPDLVTYAPAIAEERSDTGPLAGIEAGLLASAHAWSLFVPVDVPLASESLLRAWVEGVLPREQDGVRLSFLSVGGINQPTFCLVHRECLAALMEAADRGWFKLGLAFRSVAEALGPAALSVANAETFAGRLHEPQQDLKLSFSNLNTPEDLAFAEGQSARPVYSA